MSMNRRSFLNIQSEVFRYTIFGILGLLNATAYRECYLSSSEPNVTICLVENENVISEATISVSVINITDCNNPGVEVRVSKTSANKSHLINHKFLAGWRTNPTSLIRKDEDIIQKYLSKPADLSMTRNQTNVDVKFFNFTVPTLEPGEAFEIVQKCDLSRIDDETEHRWIFQRGSSTPTRIVTPTLIPTPTSIPTPISIPTPTSISTPTSTSGRPSTPTSIPTLIPTPTPRNTSGDLSTVSSKAQPTIGERRSKKLSTGLIILIVMVLLFLALLLWCIIRYCRKKGSFTFNSGREISEK